MECILKPKCISLKIYMPLNVMKEALGEWGGGGVKINPLTLLKNVNQLKPLTKLEQTFKQSMNSTNMCTCINMY